jgi:Protein of unknown function, DUF481
MSRLTLCLLLVSLACPVTAWAQNDDVVQLINGDRTTGRIRELDRGRLEVSGTSAGRVQIRWKEVSKITTNKRFLVETSTGARYYGSIKSPTPGHLEVDTDKGPVTLDNKVVVRLLPTTTPFPQSVRGDVAFGFSLSAPPQVTTSYELESNVNHRTRNYETFADFESLLERSSGTNLQTRNFFNIDPRRLLTEHWFAMALLQVQQDHFLTLDHRVVLGGGGGRTLIANQQTRFSLFGGFNYNGEGYSSPSTSDNTGEAFVGVRWDFFPQSTTVDLDTRAETFISLQRARARLEVDSELRDYVFRRLFWGLEVFESFDSDPGGTRNQSDFGATINLGWRFR